VEGWKGENVGSAQRLASGAPAGKHPRTLKSTQGPPRCRWPVPQETADLGPLQEAAHEHWLCLHQGFSLAATPSEA
jgi:hypothetical protein